MPQLPAISLEGLKGVGKTETARRRARTINELDDPAQRAIAEADPARLLSGQPPILIDEWQRVPASWDIVRRAVDAACPPSRFLLTGSASPATAPSHSGAGRIVTVRMRPLSLAERKLTQPTVSMAELLLGKRPGLDGSCQTGLEDYVAEIVQSGLPGLRGYSGRALRAQLDGYLHRIIERDFKEQGLTVRRPETLRRWLIAYADATATSASFEASETGPRAARGGSLLGRLFESLVTLSLRVYAQANEAQVRHLRLHGGQREIDLIIERPDRRVLALEVKLSRTVGDDDVRQLLWLRDQIGDQLLDALVVHTGPQAYRRRDGIGVVPAALLTA